jgi:hypothetical protein
MLFKTKWTIFPIYFSVIIVNNCKYIQNLLYNLVIINMKILSIC